MPDPLTTVVPVSEISCGAGTEAGFNPEPGLPSGSAGSPPSAKLTSTPSRYQSPHAGARSAVKTGAAGSPGDDH